MISYERRLTAAMDSRRSLTVADQRLDAGVARLVAQTRGRRELDDEYQDDVECKNSLC